MTTLRNRIRLWNHYVRDVSGVAAIEFGLILPILFALFLGLAEYARMTMYARRLDQVTAMMSDLVAREDQINDAGFTGILAGVDTAWGNFDNIDNLRFSIKSVRRTISNTKELTYVDWDKEIREAPTVTKNCSSYPLPNDNMIAKGNSLILVTGLYTYNTLLGVRIPAIGLSSTQMNWASVSHHTPRGTACIDYNGVKCAEDSRCE